MHSQFVSYLLKLHFIIFSVHEKKEKQNFEPWTLKVFISYIISYFPLQTSVRAYEHSGFKLRLILDESEIKFEPTFSDFQVVLLNVFDVMIKASRDVPRVETKLYSEWVSTCQLMSFFPPAFYWKAISLWGFLME